MFSKTEYEMYHTFFCRTSICYQISKDTNSFQLLGNIDLQTNMSSYALPQVFIPLTVFFSKTISGDMASLMLAVSFVLLRIFVMQYNHFSNHTITQWFVQARASNCSDAALLNCKTQKIYTWIPPRSLLFISRKSQEAPRRHGITFLVLQKRIAFFITSSDRKSVGNIFQKQIYWQSSRVRKFIRLSVPMLKTDW